MVPRVLAAVLAVAIGASSLRALPLPFSAPGRACPTRAAACCCQTCPGAPVCPCDHGKPEGAAVCRSADDPASLATGRVAPVESGRLSCEIPKGPAPDPLTFRHSALDLTPQFPHFSEPPDKVPIA